MNENKSLHTKRQSALSLLNPPQTTALSWCIVTQIGDELVSKSPSLKLEVASLTKIMTAYTAIQLCEDLNLDYNEINIRIPRIATQIGGTSAFLRRDDILSLVELLYALMLPSGNDAAISIALHFGSILNTQRKQKIASYITCDTIQGFYDDTQMSNMNRFVRQMNENAMKLGMRDSQFSNPHGLSSKANKSTASDMCRMSSAYLKIPVLKQICNSKSFSCRNYEWFNTNQLLHFENYNGIKTGITPNAGACLAVSYESVLGSIIVVLIGAKDQKRRFEETDKLINWVSREYSLYFNKTMYPPPRTASSKGRSFIIKKQV
ncbi:unnamed protein product (macronuclear) [Paramecium tetraurelia]|uniref:Peptidase S11 D-alanyl-D-alanine carboxypeptidase A N-terminal domain-containing protein n=1 Tax=Paramecium tetraurelia TaxID=5888 RepID=A0CIW3_PARTE|nr:uncharacterized protein GSPATT00007865001 [Paramecium tetraurelia]CAK70730.1 unnamed protein product [Paramecium tetraurelia]|eukprot:XP_001438127.1 hypothetical protein (macronuclear) [Paramecium tetraurelia strain d4-2]